MLKKGVYPRYNLSPTVCILNVLFLPYSGSQEKPIMTSANTPQKPINIAVLTVSDTRTVATDKSGTTLIERLQEAGHSLAQHLSLIHHSR